ncbi:PTS sugar transporter [Paenibacillus albiflavus]|uniref:PTS sugar transporter n=1 Tax=Paenibacillus albiflavus TaxID=2545760 RepID=A0A4R4E8Q1_9BACL|nr:PTS transporter subunit EIIC [Paenibacillus albiflavus]TCZ75353.1 PTS sugar transporter [Paenibacillus albiflavus]
MLGFLQAIARSLMIPIAVLPAAAILLRIGKVDFNHPFLIQIAKVCHLGGSAIFDNLPLLFAIGIAIGMTGGEGIAALAATVGYLVFQNVLHNFDTLDANQVVIDHLDMGVLGGIMTGFITVVYYRKYKNLQLPKVLGFFGGKRFIPIITSLTMVAVGVGIGFIWPTVQEWIRQLGLTIMSAGGAGVFTYGFLNRLLIPTGLHHILNSIAWYQIGEYTEATGKIVHGDMTRFFAGDASAGRFMTGFFPIMMFGLPAAALAMIKFVHKKQKKVISSILLSAGLTSFFTGVTEPIEFAFMFSSPVLYVVHAFLTGTALMLTHLLDVKLGFSFSAGLIDLMLNWNSGKHTLVIVLIGIGYFIVYYFVFIGCIKLLRLKTPGREVHESDTDEITETYTLEQRVSMVIRQIGGLNNIETVDACITRLRLKLKHEMILEEADFTKLGAYGLMNMGRGNVHIVFGTDSELIKDGILALMSARGVGRIV